MAPPIKAPVLLSGNVFAAVGHLRRADHARPHRGAGDRWRAGDPGRRRPDRSRARRPRRSRAADPYKLAAAIDHFVSAAAGKPSSDVVIASASNDDSAYAMPAAGWAAESGDPILFVSHSDIPAGHKPGAPGALEAEHLRARPGQRGVRRCGHAAGQVRQGQAGRRFGPRRQLGRVHHLPRPRVPGQPALRPRPGQLRLGDAQPRARLRADQLQADARRGRRGAAGGQRQLRAGAAARQAGGVADLRAELLPRLRDPGLHPGGADRGRLQPWLGDRRDPLAVSVGVQAQMDNLLEAVPQK